MSIKLFCKYFSECLLAGLVLLYVHHTRAIKIKFTIVRAVAKLFRAESLVNLVKPGSESGVSPRNKQASNFNVIWNIHGLGDQINRQTSLKTNAMNGY